MSKGNGTSEKKYTYLKHIALKNYRSIKNIEIDFKPGLNIIIGKNASGKTNFVNGLNSILNFKNNDLLDSEFAFEAWFKTVKIEYEASIKYYIAHESSQYGYYNPTERNKKILKINGKNIEVPENEDERHHLRDRDIFFLDIFIKHGAFYKEDSLFINVPLSFLLMNDTSISNQMLQIGNNNSSRSMFIEAFFYRMYISISQLFDSARKKNDMSEDDLKQKIVDISERCLSKINSLIFTCSPIKAIRINPNFNIITDYNVYRKQTISNFLLEFLIDNNWLSFNLLSDGTKRMFYIVSELLSRDALVPTDDNNDLIIVLLEEPELGIHPHQLHLLIHFLKEQSRYKQIILTTHSPQVLDSLEPDELDRIIICSHDPQNGTQLNHLSDKQITKASKYMEAEAFLSDYWRFSDLEPA